MIPKSAKLKLTTSRENNTRHFADSQSRSVCTAAMALDHLPTHHCVCHSKWACDNHWTTCDQHNFQKTIFSVSVLSKDQHVLTVSVPRDSLRR